MRRIVFITMVVAAVATLASCGKGPNEGARHSKLAIEQSTGAHAVDPLGHTAAPSIDPERRPLVVLAPPSAPQLSEKRQAQLQEERAKTEADIHCLMDRYTENLRRPADKARYQEQIAQQLDTYKRQMLQIYKFQQQAPTSANAAGQRTAAN